MDSSVVVPEGELVELCRRYRVARLQAFGSAVRGELRPESDIDLLVEFEPGHEPSLAGLARFKRDLSRLFGGRDVDVATRSILENPFRRKRILADLETLYAA